MNKRSAVGRSLEQFTGGYRSQDRRRVSTFDATVTETKRAKQPIRDCLLDVAFQHGEKFAQLALGFGGVVGVVDAMVHVHRHELFGQ